MKMYDFRCLFEETRKILRTAALQDVSVTDISSADSSFQYEKIISSIICKKAFPDSINFCSYYFTGSISPDILTQLKNNLGTISSSGIVLLPSATLAINTLLLFLKQWINKIAIVSPYYFISSNICDTLGIKYKIFPVEKSNAIRIPIEKICQDDFDAVFITSPIYGTSEYFSKGIIEDIELLKSGGKYVIIDEALTLPGYELSRYVTQDNHSFHIYSPHKSIGINAYKFSAIICSTDNEQQLRECVDTHVGGLNQTSVAAISHYISDNFSICKEEYLKLINNAKEVLIESIQTTDGQLSLANGIGHYASILPNIDFPGIDVYLNALKSCVIENNIAFIPPWPDWHNGFKINMTYPSCVIEKAIDCIVKNFGLSIYAKR